MFTQQHDAICVTTDQILFDTILLSLRRWTGILEVMGPSIGDTRDKDLLHDDKVVILAGKNRAGGWEEISFPFSVAAAASPVLKSMFSGNFQKGNQISVRTSKFLQQEHC